MAKEHSLEDLWSKEELFSGPARAIRHEIDLLKTYHAFETFKEIEEYVKQFEGNKRPFRAVSVISDPLHFDELEYFRYHFNKLFRPHDFGWQRRVSEAGKYERQFIGSSTYMDISLTYNRGLPLVIGPVNKQKIVRDNEDTVALTAFPGVGISVECRRIVDGSLRIALRHSISYEELAADPDRLSDALWDVAWNNPPIAR